MHHMHFAYRYPPPAQFPKHYQLFVVILHSYLSSFCYLFATNGVFCYRFWLNLIKQSITQTPQNIKVYIKILKFIKSAKNGLLIRMSLVRVQLPEPRFTRRPIGAVFVRGRIPPRARFNNFQTKIANKKQGIQLPIKIFTFNE